uniref:Uncharacterized protein n=1 Tax=Balaenoptera musculus TaxID=9771 RepID=A0A8C0CJX4_BALMU
MEQIKLLKSEIRRLERNQAREQSAANLEYLKNVLLRFILLKPGSERERLLPVWTRCYASFFLAVPSHGGKGKRALQSLL